MTTTTNGKIEQFIKRMSWKVFYFNNRDNDNSDKNINATNNMNEF